MMKRHVLWLLVALLVITVPGSVQASGLAQDDPPQQYTWDAYGLTVMLPDEWQAIPGTQNFDLVLVSPGAMAGEQEAPYIGIQTIPYLGPDPDPAAILEEQIGGEAEPYTMGDLQGARVIQENDDSPLAQYLVLVPYGDDGAAMFIIAFARPDRFGLIDDTLATISIDPPQPDYAAIDAAWQASLESQGRLLYGNADAPVAMLEFLSFTCGHCANYSAEVERLIALEVEEGRLRLEIDLLASEEYSQRATYATYCATEQGKGYSAYKTLFDGSRTDGAAAAYSQDGIERLLSAPALGLDLDALTECMAEEKYSEQIAQTRTRFLEYERTGTPAVLLADGDGEFRSVYLPDGRLWSGGIPITVIREVVRLVIEEDMTLEQIFQPPSDADTSRNPSFEGLADRVLNTDPDTATSSSDAASDGAGDGGAAARADADESDDDSSDSLLMAVIAGGAALLGLSIIGLVIISRRQSPTTVEADHPGEDDHAA
jgi:protein-disulfide isomerase